MKVLDMLQSLISYGLSQESIAERVGVTQPTISRILKGANTTWEVGKRIECLYEETKTLEPKRSTQNEEI